MNYYSQIDPRWGGKHIGNSPTTIHAAGCALTALTNGVNAICKTDVKPDVIASQDVFVPEANNKTIVDIIDWDKAAAYFGIRHDSSRDGQNDALIDQYLADPNKFVIFQVNNGHHFVLGWKKTIFGKYQCLDSWDGKVKDVINAYHNISGCRYFSKKV